MKKSISTYRFVLLFALVASLLAAICYAPAIQECVKVCENTEAKDDNTDHEQVLTIAQHVLTNISFSIHSDSKLPVTFFEYTHLGFSSEVVHKISAVLFSISYLENIFPFSISPQAP